MDVAYIVRSRRLRHRTDDRARTAAVGDRRGWWDGYRDDSE
jgi:hypothetical protein